MQTLIKKVRFFKIGVALCKDKSKSESDFGDLEEILQDLDSPYMSEFNTY